MPVITQIGPGLIGIYQGPQLDQLVGFVYSTVAKEWWALRTSAPAYTWPGDSGIGVPTTTRFVKLSEPSYATCLEFSADIEWPASEYQIIDCTCSNGCQT